MAFTLVLVLNDCNTRHLKFLLEIDGKLGIRFHSELSFTPTSRFFFQLHRESK